MINCLLILFLLTRSSRDLKSRYGGKKQTFIPALPVQEHGGEIYGKNNFKNENCRCYHLYINFIVDLDGKPFF